MNNKIKKEQHFIFIPYVWIVFDSNISNNDIYSKMIIK